LQSATHAFIRVSSDWCGWLSVSMSSFSAPFSLAAMDRWDFSKVERLQSDAMTSWRTVTGVSSDAQRFTSTGVAFCAVSDSRPSGTRDR